MDSPITESMSSSKLPLGRPKRMSLLQMLRVSNGEIYCFDLFDIDETNAESFEPLYKRYNHKRKTKAVRILHVAFILFILSTSLTLTAPKFFQVCLNDPRQALRTVIWLIILVIWLMMSFWYFVFARLREQWPFEKITFLLTCIHMFMLAFTYFDDANNEGLGWMVVLIYLHFTTMPLMFWELLVSAAMLISVFFAAQALNQHQGTTEEFLQEQFLNGILILAAAACGVDTYLTNDREQRIAFLEARRNLQLKLLIEEQSKEQERLLLSVLPEHVAEQMRKDLGAIDRQFKKIYMSRHENVSILYADIVGFTAISSTYSAQDLVAILNELFARFDKLAEKYQQLRIKILGDCYYCISGAPVERPDHAILSVHMGLSMVKAIKYVQQITSSPVDMRVGIHTGAVLAGVLGQRQWQFDVYSRDVELANKMESSGMPGRVHISEMTLGFLDDHFEVEPAHGEKREEALRQANIRTYFISKVLKPFIGCHPVESNGDMNLDPSNKFSDKGEWEEGAETPSELKEDEEDSVKSPLEESKTEDVALMKRLEDEILSSPCGPEVEGKTTMCLTFKEKAMEDMFQKQSKGGLAPLLMGLIGYLPGGIAILTVREGDNIWMDAIVIPLCACILIAGIIYLHRRKFWSEFEACRLVLTLSHVIFLFVESYAFQIACLIKMVHGEYGCKRFSYLFHTITLCFITALYISPQSFLKYTTVVVVGVTATILLYTVHRPFFDLAIVYENHKNMTDTNYHHDVCEMRMQLFRHVAMIACMGIIFVLYIYYTELCSRSRFVRATRLSEARSHAADMRRRNVQLVYNLLPPHVAINFMGAHRRRHHRDLYSQSLQEVGVLFASMPNFTEFYSEETVNNQGLECLRFLNEVISDFDALLDKPQFKDIIKIKTIGSTYMAASGLNPTKESEPGDSVTKRWEHLDRLVQFALELKEALQGINEQSFNHFVLKMGVNHGPITAGVIGAKKPHYDIWGNTVNVASRMESTGKAGCIQVTAETCDILKQFGYTFEQRGLVAVKGKGQLMTYYLLGKNTHSHYQEPPLLSSDVIFETNESSPLIERGIDEPVNHNDIKLNDLSSQNIE